MKFKKKTLKNGVRVILAPMKGTKTATVVVMANVGSRYETEREAGLSHFLEHMMFKGTKNRPDTLSITSELDAIGGEYNAFTGKDRTGYYAKVNSKHIDTAIDVISDIYLNSTLDQKEIKKEKGTILQEINMYEDTPLRNINDIFENLIFSGNSLGREEIGYKKTVSSFFRKSFVSYMSRFYTGQNTVVCVAGKFDEKKVFQTLKKIFGKMKKGKKEKFEEFKEKQKNPELKIKNKKTDQTHLILGVRAYDYFHKDRYTLSVLATILGGNMSSRLFTEVRERRGLAYAVKTFVESYADAGYLATLIGVDHNKTRETIEIVAREYKKIAHQEVSQEELIKAKEYLKGKAVMGFESSDEVAIFLIEQETRKNKILTLEEILKKVDRVTSKDVLKVAQDIFLSEKLNLAVIGPGENKREIKEVLKL